MFINFSCWAGSVPPFLGWTNKPKHPLQHICLTGRRENHFTTDKWSTLTSIEEGIFRIVYKSKIQNLSLHILCLPITTNHQGKDINQSRETGKRLEFNMGGSMDDSCSIKLLLVNRVCHKLHAIQKLPHVKRNHTQGPQGTWVCSKTKLVKLVTSENF